MKTNFDLRKLDSLTKYPSILTYHELGDKGRLKDSLVSTFPFNAERQPLYLSEKLDGENSRIILVIQDREVDYFIGTRDELIFAKDDRIFTKKGNMVNTVKPFADSLVANEDFINIHNNKLVVIYGESYGGTVQKACKQYTSKNNQSFRMFDSFILPLEEVSILLEKELNAIATWRDKGNQPFLNRNNFEELSHLIEFETTPILGTVPSKEMPISLIATMEWLQQYKYTKANLDEVEQGLSEGVVVRSFDRSFIAKLRFEDYERTLRINKNIIK